MAAPSARRPGAGGVPGRRGARWAVRTPPATWFELAIVVQDRADAAPRLEQRIAAVAGQVQVEGLVRLTPGVAPDFDRDRLGGLAGGEGQRAGPGDVVVVAGRRRAVHRAERHRHRLVVGDREADREDELRLLAVPL